MKNFKLYLIFILCIIASITSTLWYRVNQIIELKEQIELTETLLKTVNWNKTTRDYLNSIGYDIPVPVAPASKKEEKE